MSKINKRGQISIFILIGVVIVFAAFFFGYLQNQGLRQRVESNLFGTVVVPDQAQAVVNYLDNCIYDIAGDGVNLMGFQGGYINPASKDIRGILKIDPVNSIPYWIYGTNVVVPKPQEMRDELESYINARANEECDFQGFSDYNFDTDDINVNVDITDDGVLVKLDSEINVEIKGNTYSMKDYVSVNIPAELKELYEMAVDIVNREIRKGTIGIAPFEALTVELIAAHTKEEDSGLPPMSKFDYTCNPQTWFIGNVHSKLKEVIADGSRYIRVEDADNADYGDYYKNLVVDDVFKSSHDASVNFNYNPEWPLYLDIYPGGNVLKPSTIKLGLPFIPLFCFNTYNFRYNIQYPLMVNLEKEGYLFRFPIEVYIIDNYAGRNIEGEINADFEEQVNSFCDENQRLSENMSMISISTITGLPLNDVQVVYNCGVNSCVIGNTKLISGEARLSTSLPLCFNGELRLSKEGFGNYAKELTTLNSPSQNILADLKPYFEKEVKARVIEIRDGVASERKLYDNEVTSIQFNVIDLATDSIKEQIPLIFEGDSIEKINLLPEERYNIQVNLVLNDKITIPGGKYQGKDLPGQVVDNVLLGGANFETFISNEDLNKNKITVFALSNGIPRTYQEYIDNTNINELTDLNRDKVELRFE